jgi:hypothetical protein
MDKPPDVASSSCLLPPTFLIGRNSRGNWVAQERGRACGGLFANREAALKFAKFESGDHPHAIVWVSGALELDIACAGPGDSRVKTRTLSGFSQFAAV